MGLFKKSDELFEIMSRQTGGRAGMDLAATPSMSTRATRRPEVSWKAKRPADDGALFEIDGDALVVIDDPEVAGAEGEEEGAGRTFAIRTDSLVVGGFLTAGLVVTSFLVGRRSDEPPVAPSLALSPPAAVAPATPGFGATSALVPASAVAEAQQQQQAATPAPTPSQPTAVKGSFRPEQATTAQAAASPHAATTVASAPASNDDDAATPSTRKVADGKFVLVVCSTTPANATRLAEWLNTAPRSPIFGRGDLEAYATRRGVVRIRGFGQRDRDVLGRVQATADPLGGSGTFHSAYYKSP